MRALTTRDQKSYLREVSKFAKYFNKSTEELREKELKEYLLNFLNKRKLSRGTFWLYYSSLKFLYRHTLKRECVVEKIRRPQGKKKLSVVQNLEEIIALLFLFEESQQQGSPDDHLFCGTQDKRNSTSEDNRH